MTSEPVRIGVAGLGRAFVLMLPTFRNDPRVKLVAAAAPRAESRAAFETEFGGRSYASIEEMAADPEWKLSTSRPRTRCMQTTWRQLRLPASTFLSTSHWL